MTGVLLLGVLLGMRHALESDHVVAVASLATPSRSVIDTIRQGIAWGLGHTLTLLLFGAVVLVLGVAAPVRWAHALEFAVGVMLLVLGVDVLQRMIQARMHVHTHRHADGAVHSHAHAHAGERQHDSDHHHHEHRRGVPRRALLVGLVHGMVGSSALILLTVQTVYSPLMGLAYIGLFGLDSIAGMALLAGIIALPLRYSAQYFTRLHHGLQAVVGVATIALGINLIVQIVAAR